VIAGLVVLAALALALATAASFSRDWRLRLLVHFRPHLAVACGVAMVALLAVSLPIGPKLALLALLAASAAVHWREVARSMPLVTPAGAPASGERRLRIAAANLLRSNHDTQRAIDWVRREKVDVFVASEALDHWPRALAALSDEFLHVAGHGSGDVLVFSRRPMTGEPRHLFADIGYAVAVEIDGLTVLGVHTASPQMHAMSVACDALLEGVSDLVRATPGPIVAVGDFNATPWSAPVVRLVADTGLAYGPGARIGTLPAEAAGRKLPAWLGIPIDLVLAGHGASVAQRRHGARIGSDHWPVIAEIRYFPDRPVP